MSFRHVGSCLRYTQLTQNIVRCWNNVEDISVRVVTLPYFNGGEHGQFTKHLHNYLFIAWVMAVTNHEATIVTTHIIVTMT